MPGAGGCQGGGPRISRRYWRGRPVMGEGDDLVKITPVSGRDHGIMVHTSEMTVEARQEEQAARVSLGSLILCLSYHFNTCAILISILTSSHAKWEHRNIGHHSFYVGSCFVH